MDLWDKYNPFSAEFLAQNHDIVLCNVWHQVKALLLYPLNCSCTPSCRCDEFRTKILLSLNVDLYNKTQESPEENPERLNAMRLLLKIPEESFFRKNYAQSYPLWLIEKEFRKREADNHFEIVGRLVWTLLRLAKTYETSILKEPRASRKEAVDIILGKTLFETNEKQFNDYLCGEKAYGAYLKQYKSVCHFIAASQFLSESSFLSLNSPAQIEEFLSLAHWFRRKLLALATPNSKNVLFSEETLCPLPCWVKNDELTLSVEPFEEKLQEINALIPEPSKPAQ